MVKVSYKYGKHKYFISRKLQMVLIRYERNLVGGIDFLIGNKAWLSVEDCTVIKAYIYICFI